MIDINDRALEGRLGGVRVGGVMVIGWEEQ